jgi:hypothetical protein
VVTAPNGSSAPSNPGGQGGSNNNGNGSNNGGHGSTPTSGGSANIRALLSNALLVRGKGSRIRALLKNGGYAFSFAAPSAGRLVISWYRQGSHGKKTLVATATVLFHKTGTTRIKVLLTGKGRGLLTRASRMKLTASGAFTPTGKGTVSASRVIMLKP